MSDQITYEWLMSLDHLLRFNRTKDWPSGTFDVDVFLDGAYMCVRFWQDGDVDVILGKTGDTQLNNISRSRFLSLLTGLGVEPQQHRTPA